MLDIPFFLFNQSIIFLWLIFPEWVDELLHKYQNITGYSDTRINSLCILLNRQIEKLGEMIKKVCKSVIKVPKKSAKV